MIFKGQNAQRAHDSRFAAAGTSSSQSSSTARLKDFKRVTSSTMSKSMVYPPVSLRHCLHGLRDQVWTGLCKSMLFNTTSTSPGTLFLVARTQSVRTMRVEALLRVAVFLERPGSYDEPPRQSSQPSHACAECLSWAMAERSIRATQSRTCSSDI